MKDEEQTLDAFNRWQLQGRALFATKQRQYGNAIRFTGVLGACVELVGVVFRLPALVLKSKDHGRNNKHKLEDILLDIHNYALIGLIMIEDDNWEGKTE